MLEDFNIFGDHILWRGKIREAIMEGNFDKAREIAIKGSKVKDLLSELEKTNGNEFITELDEIYRQMIKVILKVIDEAKEGKKEVALRNLLSGSEIDEFWKRFKETYIRGLKHNLKAV
jgi:flagellin-specific chaperone FliS